MREGNQLLLHCLGYQGDTKVAQDSGDDNIVIKTLLLAKLCVSVDICVVNL